MSQREKAQRSRWPWISLVPIGVGAWAPIYAGLRANCKSWIAWGSLWTTISLAGWIITATQKGTSDIAGLCLIVGWVGGAAPAFTIRGEYERRMASPLLQATARGRRRIADRQRALELARRDPALAREIGVGRPDERGAVDVGLVDVNNATVTALLELPGIDGDIATQIVEMRGQLVGFSSLEDLGERLDLDGNVVDGLRGEVVFLREEQLGAFDAVLAASAAALEATALVSADGAFATARVDRARDPGRKRHCAPARQAARSCQVNAGLPIVAGTS